MQKLSNEIEIIRQLFGSLSEKDKKTFLKSIKFRDEPSKKEQIKRTITHCPHCNSVNFSKICKDCKKTFGIRQDVWNDFKDPQYPRYPTEKNLDMLELIVRQSSNEDSIIMDCFCGSGSFLHAGLNNNRNVIGIDIGSQSIKIAKKNIAEK